jgi:hypothetical protein
LLRRVAVTISLRKTKVIRHGYSKIPDHNSFKT